MTPMEVGFAGMGLALLLLALRVPIAFSLLIAGFAGFAYIRGLGPAFGLIGALPNTSGPTMILPLLLSSSSWATSAFIRI